MDVHCLQIGDIILSSYGFMKNHFLYGKIIAIFSDGLIFFDNINNDNGNDEYEEVYAKEVTEINISSDSLIHIGFTKDDDGNFIKSTINEKGTVVITENTSYIKLPNSDSIIKMPFSLYSLMENNTLHMLQRAVRDIVNDEIV